MMKTSIIQLIQKRMKIQHLSYIRPIKKTNSFRKKTILIHAQLIIIMLLTSCSLTSEDYEQAASDTCFCFKESVKANEELNLSKSVDLIYALCTLEAEKEYGLTIQNQEFESALKETCPELLKIHFSLVKKNIVF